ILDADHPSTGVNIPRRFTVTRDSHLRRDQGRIVANLEFALGRLYDKRRLFGGHGGRSQQVKPKDQGK
ncbi:MAG: hypothetical protein ACOYLK_03110, partial [Sphingomonas sp.]